MKCIIKPEEIKGLPINKIINGDVLEALKRLPSNSVDCIVTSPPYWSLRDYGVEGQIGLESTLEEYLDNLLKVTKELKRILKPTGVMFWNHGDSFGGNKAGGPLASDKSKLGNGRGRGAKMANEVFPNIKTNYPNKCLTLQATRLAICMIDEQKWILRNDIIWYKPNHMPESVKDRFTKAYEHIFMFTKEEKYWFDLDAVREPHKEISVKRANYEQQRTKDEGLKSLNRQGGLKANEVALNPLGKNPGDVWVINTEPFPEAHFAVFPTKLVERCILAGCPEWICKKCGKPRERIVEKMETIGRNENKTPASGQSAIRVSRAGESLYQTIGWTDCGCNAGWKPGIVLDPFLGSGTTALVALKLGRDFIGIELNEDYCKMAYSRIKSYLNQPKLTGWFE